MPDVRDFIELDDDHAIGNRDYVVAVYDIDGNRTEIFEGDKHKAEYMVRSVQAALSTWDGFTGRNEDA